MMRLMTLPERIPVCKRIVIVPRLAGALAAAYADTAQYRAFIHP
jgi:hypothetical protein